MTWVKTLKKYCLRLGIYILQVIMKYIYKLLTVILFFGFAKASISLVHSCAPSCEYPHTCQNNMCKLKPLFPMSIRDIFMTITVFFGGVISSGVGLGGSLLYIPFMSLIGGLPISAIIPLSKITILGLSILNFFVYTPRRHEVTNKPLVNYDMIMVLEPFILLGTIIGVLFNVMFPNWLIIVLLLILVVLITIRMTYQAVKLFSKERKSKKDKSTRPESSRNKLSEPTVKIVRVNDIIESILDEDLELSEVQQTHQTIEMQTHEATEVDKTQTGDKKDKTRNVILKYIVLFVCWAIIFTLSVLRGSPKRPSIAGVQPCSTVYWTLYGITFPIILFISSGVMMFVITKYHLTKDKKVDGDIEIKWDVKKVLVVPIASIFGGIISGLVGNGGGLIKTPLLLELGIHPDSIKATSSVMMLFTSSIISAQYILLDQLPIDYGLWFMGFGFLAAIFGQLLVEYGVNRFKKPSLIIFIIILINLVSVILIAISGAFTIIHDIKTNTKLGFSGVC
jgi:uncharacterized membrane protein YfcA